MQKTFTKTILRQFYKLAQPFLTLDITHLIILDGNTLKSAPVADNVQVSCLTAEQVRQHAVDPTNQFDSSLVVRIESGLDICVAALVDGELAAYAWFAFESIEAAHNCGRTVHSGTAISFPDHMVFLYKAFTLPQFRGRGLYRSVNTFALDHLRPQGITTILATTDWSNFPALRSCYGLGFEKLGSIWRVGVGRHVAGVYPNAARPMRIRFGNDASVVERIAHPAANVVCQV